MKIITRQLKLWMNGVSCRVALLFIPLAVTCFAPTQTARAACQEGCLANSNTVLGDNALVFNTGQANTAIGSHALNGNTTGIANTATGSGALADNSTGSYNTAFGEDTLAFNSTGNNNTCIGTFAMAGDGKVLITGSNNTATGFEALQLVTTGSSNTASGVTALLSNKIGNNNTATGVDALRSNTSGNYNTADGQASLYGNTIGRNNTGLGQNALRNNSTGSFNVALGGNAGFNLTTGSNNIDVGNSGVAGESNTIRIGRQGTQTATFVAGISGSAVTGSTVTVNSNGQLGVAPSSERFKQNIQKMGETSEVLEALRPVTFQYKADIDPKGIPQFGLVADAVEKVAPELVTHDEQGKPYTVRYEAVNAMLLNEFLKEHRKVQELQGTLIQQQKMFESKLAAQRRQIEALTAGLQKVSDRLEASKSSHQLVFNTQ